MPLGLTAIRRYPVKSCRGEDLDAAEVEPWGLAGDRRFMLVDDSGEAVTAREHNQLPLATPSIDASGLRVTMPGCADLIVPIPDRWDTVPVEIWGSKLDAALAGQAAHEWFSKILDCSVRLVYLDDPTRRRLNPKYSRPEDRVMFADAYPLLLTSAASLAQLCRLAERELSMIRFRPNLVVSGGRPWAEDGWRRIRVGNVPFRVVKSSDRCVMTTVDPYTAVRGKEPIATLARFRRWDGKTWFGVNLIPDRPGLISRGDRVEILEQVDSDEPLR